jgi:hypothetical protein
MSESDFYNIEKILDRRKINGKLEYKIKWEGYPMNQSTWEPMENLITAKELVDEYDKQYPFTNDMLNKKTKRIKKMSAKKPVKKAAKKENEPQIQEKTENEPQKEEEKPEQINLEENQINNDINIQNDPIRKYNIDDSLKKVTTVRKRDNKLMAVVVKMNELGMTNEIEIETNSLKYDNPWILLDFYESKIKFT